MSASSWRSSADRAARPLSPAALRAIEVGRRHEVGLDEAVRRRGTHYTPPAAAAMLIDLALDRWRGRGVPNVLDPAAGAGALLVAAADRLVDGGVGVGDALGAVRGVEVDPTAAEVADAALRGWAQERAGDVGRGGGGGSTGRPPAGGEDRVRCVAVGDGLAVGRHAADVVVANPPFGGQRRTRTTRSPELNGRLRRLLGDDVVDLTVDTAALFLLTAADGLAPGGVAAVLQPRPVLATSGAAGVRRVLAGSVAGIWLPSSAGFDAAVEVCAVVCGPPGGPRSVGPVRVWTGDDPGRFVEVGRDVVERDTWAGAVARADGVPPLGGLPARRLGDVATANAGFRDEYYALVGAVVEGRPEADGAPLLTTAHVDPARSWWGSRSVRIAGRRWVEPWVDLDRLGREASPRVQRWVTARRVPKVVVATQTRVLEAVADPGGVSVPLTPLVSLTSGTVAVDLLLAAVVAPPATLWAHHHHGATGRSRGALRLAGRDLLRLPLPDRSGPWAELAGQLRSPPAGRAAWEAAGRLGCAAWGWEGEVADRAIEWWMERLPSAGG